MRKYSDMRDTENDEEGRPQRPRVVDKRVSARPQTPGDRPAAPDAGGPRDTTPAGPPGAAPSDAGPQPPREEHGVDPVAGPGGVAGGTRATGPSPGPTEEVWTPEQEAEAQQMAREIAERPAADWILNSAITLANVAAIKLEAGAYEEARLTIDGLAGMVEGTADRLGNAEAPLRQTLAQLQMAYAQSIAGGQPGGPPTPG